MALSKLSTEIKNLLRSLPISELERVWAEAKRRRATEASSDVRHQSPMSLRYDCHAPETK